MMDFKDISLLEVRRFQVQSLERWKTQTRASFMAAVNFDE
jgi:hypothetical protein